MINFSKTSGTLLAGVASLSLFAAAAQAQTDNTGNTDRNGGDDLNTDNSNGMDNNTGVRHHTTPDVNMNDTGSHGYGNNNSSGGGSNNNGTY